MKQMTCAQMGGPADCSKEIQGRDAEEMAKVGFDHVIAEHPEMAQKIQSNTKEENDKWMAEFKLKVDALPEME